MMVGFFCLWQKVRFFLKIVDLLTLYFRYSILPTLSLDGILHLEVLDHSFLGKEFQDFVSGVLDRMQPWPLPNLEIGRAHV